MFQYSLKAAIVLALSLFVFTGWLVLTVKVKALGEYTYIYPLTGSCFTGEPVPPIKPWPAGNCKGRWAVPASFNLLKEPYCSTGSLPAVQRSKAETSPYCKGGSAYWVYPGPTNYLSQPYYVGMELGTAPASPIFTAAPVPILVPTPIPVPKLVPKPTSTTTTLKIVPIRQTSNIKKLIDIREMAQGGDALIRGTVLKKISSFGSTGDPLLELSVFGQTYRAHIVPGAKVIHGGGGTIEVSNFKEGDIVNVWGLLDASDPFLIHARVVRDASIRGISRVSAIFQSDLTKLPFSTNNRSVFLEVLGFINRIFSRG